MNKNVMISTSAGAVTLAVLVVCAATVTMRSYADGQAEIAWEKDHLGVSFANDAQHLLEMWMPPSEYVVTAIAHMEPEGAIWVGTTDGLAICRQDGTPENRILRAAASRTEYADPGVGAIVTRAHSIITRIVPVAEGRVWVKALRGSYLLDRKGKVLEDCLSERQSVERLYGLITKDARVRESFPALGNKVYAPLAGSMVGEFDGGKWSYVGGLIADSSVRRVHVVGERVYAAGRRGLLRIPDGKFVIESNVLVEVVRIGDRQCFCVGGGLWFLDGEAVTRLSNYPEAQGLGVCSLGQGEFLVSCYDNDTVSLCSVRDRTVRAMVLPAGHRWRAFLRHPARNGDAVAGSPASGRTTAPEGRVFILTSRGVLVSDLSDVTEIVRFSVPAMASPWREALAYGVSANCAFIRQREMFIGTGIGLAKYNLDSKKMEWVWRASP